MLTQPPRCLIGNLLSTLLIPGAVCGVFVPHYYHNRNCVSSVRHPQVYIPPFTIMAGPNDGILKLDNLSE